MRDDVQRFAEMMSKMMDDKEREKGPINGEYSLQRALMNLEAQWNKMRETPTPRGEALRRILIHLANFAMIAEDKICEERRGRVPFLSAFRVVPEENFYRRCQSHNKNGVQCGQRAGHEGKHSLGDHVQPW